MLDAEKLAEMSPQQYLNHFHINFYLQELLSLILSRKRGDGRSALEFVGQYFDAVLRGDHVLHRSFEYINGTPVNRRAFVALLRRAMSGIADPGSTALTTHDFHDLVLKLCEDFPMSIVEEAAQHAEIADVHRHCLLGETQPIAAPDEGSEEQRAECGTLLVLGSLQRLVECLFVYSEVFDVLKRVFEQHRIDLEPADGDLSQGTQELSSRFAERSVVVTEIQQHTFRDDAALPSEHALQQLLYPSGNEATSDQRHVTVREVLAHMAEHFELVPDPHPEAELLGSADLLPGGSVFGKDTGAKASSSGPPAMPQRASSEKLRRREKNSRSR